MNREGQSKTHEPRCKSVGKSLGLGGGEPGLSWRGRLLKKQ